MAYEELDPNDPEAANQLQAMFNPQQVDQQIRAKKRGRSSFLRKKKRRSSFLQPHDEFPHRNGGRTAIRKRAASPFPSPLSRAGGAPSERTLAANGSGSARATVAGIVASEPAPVNHQQTPCTAPW